MTSSRLLIAGAGGHARACIDVVESAEGLVIGGLIGQAHEVGRELFGYPVLGTETDLPTLRASHDQALVAVGQIKTAAPREALFAMLVEQGFILPVIVSPKAYVSPRATIGAGSIVMHGAVV